METMEIGGQFTDKNGTWFIENMIEFTTTIMPGRFFDVKKRQHFHCPINLPHNDNQFYVLAYVRNNTSGLQQVLLLEREGLPVSVH